MIPQPFGFIVRSTHIRPPSVMHCAVVSEGMQTHSPWTQLSAVGQTWPQTSQLSGSLRMSVQTSPPSFVQVVRSQVQAPPRQLSPAAQIRPHPPQLSLSSNTCVQTVPPSLAEQSV